MNDFQNWFLQKTPREQIFLGVGVVAVLLTLAYALLLVPLTQDRDKQLQNNRALLAQQGEVRKLAAQLKAQQAAGTSSPRSLTQVVHGSLSKHQLAMKDFQPSGTTDVKLRLVDAEFNKVMAWLDELENTEGIQVKEVSVSADEEQGLLASVSVKLHRK